jgi:PRTRC genetic system protein B
MENITDLFSDIYLPQSGFLIYRNAADPTDCYVESFDVGETGRPLNLHLLSGSETAQLARALDSSKSLQKSFLKPKGLLPEAVLYIDPSRDGKAVWYTPAQQVDLFFADQLGIKSGRAFVPSLIWKASKTELYIYAIKAEGKPELTTTVYHAPFFNLYKTGKVCMGTVDVQISDACSLEEFIRSWQQYFFQSYFSHLIDSHSPVKGNIIQLWQKQVSGSKPFPVSALVKTGFTLNDLIQ